MKNALIGLTPGLLLAVSLASAELLSDRAADLDQPIKPMVIRSYVDTFKANKPAMVIAPGRGRTCLGLYVFDEHGNCVDRCENRVDDVTASNTCDDLIASWIPIATSRYDVEICNFGFDENSFSMAMR